MPADDVPPYELFALEFTPLPIPVEGMTPEQAELAVCRSTCEQQRLALAALQAKNDELVATVKQLHADRRALAAEVKRLRSK